MKNINKTALIIVGIIVGIILVIMGLFTSTINRVVNLEEQVNGAKASIQVQEKRRIDLIYNLVDVVQEYSKYEKSAMTEIISARQQVSNGNIEEAKLSINAIAEAYPDLKANENYTQLMTELAMTENMIAEHRNNYNNQLRSYNKYIRKFPTKQILSIMGYEKNVDFTYLDYGAPSDAPQNLFGE